MFYCKVGMLVTFLAQIRKDRQRCEKQKIYLSKFKSKEINNEVALNLFVQPLDAVIP